MAKIFLDAGHGGHDPGAIGKKSKEKDNALKVIKKLGAILKASGHTVKYSRTTDVFVTLPGRAKMANDWGADIFISAHNNSATATATGFETFIYNKTSNAKTKQLQKAVHNSIANQIGITDRGKKSANFAVVRQTNMPAVLIEYAFVSNKNDESILINQVDDLAKWTAEGVVAYFGGKVSVPKDKPTNPPPKKESKPKPSKPKAEKVTGAVADIQRKLNSRYGFSIAVDNIPGKDTKKHLIKAYQTELNKQFNAGLSVDGIWGPKTAAAIVNVRKGAKGNLTWVLQALLYIKGYNIAVDGIFGVATEKAVKSLQRAYKLAVDGIAGKATWGKLV